MTHPIADMLTRIRNAIAAKHSRVDIPASKLKLEIARILKRGGLHQQLRHQRRGAEADHSNLPSLRRSRNIIDYLSAESVHPRSSCLRWLG